MPDMLEHYRSLNPTIGFEFQTTPDTDYQWPGEPDTEPDTMLPYVHEVVAITVMGGRVLRGQAFLGGCYMDANGHHPTSDEVKADLTASGYLDQMVQEAAIDILRAISEVPDAQG